MPTPLVLLAPALLMGPSTLEFSEPQPALLLGAPLPAPILSSIAQDLASISDAVDADTDLSHVGDGELEDPQWTGSIFVGGTLSTGNTEQNQASARADAELRRENDRISLLGFWNYASQVDQATDISNIVERNWGGKGQYDYFFHEDLYGYGNAAVFSDSPQALDLRLTTGAGAGYQFFENDDAAFGVEAGAAYVNEDFVGDASDTDYIAGRLAYVYRNQLTETTLFEQDVEALVSLENADDHIVRADTRLKVQINASLFSTFQWIIDFDNTPAAGAERLDSRVSIGVTWEF